MKRGAFSLLETLIAIAIFGLASLAILTAVGQLTEGLSRVSEDGKRDLMRELALKAALETRSLRDLEKGGVLADPDGGSWRWSAEASPAETADLHRLSLRLAAQGGAETIVDTLAYKPEWSDPAIRAKKLDAKKEAILRRRAAR